MRLCAWREFSHFSLGKFFSLSLSLPLSNFSMCPQSFQLFSTHFHKYFFFFSYSCFIAAHLEAHHIHNSRGARKITQTSVAPWKITDSHRKKCVFLFLRKKLKKIYFSPLFPPPSLCLCLYLSLSTCLM